MAEAATLRQRRRAVVVAVVVALAAPAGALGVHAATATRPVTSVDALADRAEGRGNLVCARPATRDATGAMYVRCVDGLGEPIRLFYSTDVTLIAAAEAALVGAGWSTAGHGAVRVGVRGGLAASMARSLAAVVG